jgi:hypothetical protein
MKIVVTVKTEKGEKSSENEINKTVDELMKVVGFLEKKGYETKGGRCYCDGTQAVLKWKK